MQQTVAATAPLTGPDSIPLVINLRDQALAKSNRPTEFLEQSGLGIEATARTGQIVAHASRSALNTLASKIRNPTSKKEIYAVSTFDSFSLWEPFAHEGVGGATLTATEMVEAAAALSKPLKLDFFPWLGLDSPLTTGQRLKDYFEDEGFVLLEEIGSSRRRTGYFHVAEGASGDALQKVLGIRSAMLAPEYSADGDVRQQSFRAISPSSKITLPAPTKTMRAVGVFDSGIAPGALDPWVQSRHSYDVGVELDTTHGTFVAGLITAARQMNADARFPEDSAPVIDAQVLPTVAITEHILLDRIEEVLVHHGADGPRVWNCSFAAIDELNPMGYSTFAQAMDELSASHNVLFVQAAGNYVEAPARVWPPLGGLTDGIASPAEAVNSLVVGSLSHLGGFVPAGSPASYSRRGPSFGGQQKPDVVHWSGDFGPTFGALSGHGIQSIIPGDVLAESVGTSFATPLVSAIAANTWEEIEQSSGSASACPELVKGLLVHAAVVDSPPRDASHRAYYGAGVPTESKVILEDTAETFTTVHEVRLTRGVDWFKDPFPVPACLLTDDGKLQAEIIMTVAYAPVVDAAFGDECVRSSVDASFGRMVPSNGGFQLKGLVPFEKGTEPHAWERQRVEMGKWSPIKTYRAKYPQGTQGGDRWALKLSLLERVEGEVASTQRVFVILTFKGLQPSLPVYQDGLASIRANSYSSLSLRNDPRIRVRGDV
ncbi:S8 family peptidase [Arthrobacter sp. UYCu512]|uniref:S8 family peptidase n=1 Tax=Arthrobacter sp. UYCu512 TaxID=3156338 RepID=UPI003398E027